MDALTEVLTSIGLLACFFGICGVIFGAFRFWVVFIHTKKKLKNNKKTLDRSRWM